ncbi:HpcH/HpaI aldolase/citrate lyase family protein [Ascidiaceihabitans sp.]|uniref:HpcH/HpaI aldolase family protein n=1 Tax=Ascidiaceihabitans sp. TaxID=1872644 RepID=UPI003298D686
MPAPKNTFKAALLNGDTLIGCWLSLANSHSAEALGVAGFDWLLIDGEHAPNDIRSMRDQIIALDSSPSHAIVRLPIGETYMVKQVLDIGAQTILVPMVESAEEARALVKACRYPPTGVRGVGYAVTRAGKFGTIPDYGTTADDQTCLLVQVENRKGIDALDDILKVDGIDGVFVGPADLAADMGHMGDAMHPDMQHLIYNSIAKIAAAGVAPGILSLNDEMTTKAMDAGARFVAVGVDMLTLVNASKDLVKKWKS